MKKRIFALLLALTMVIALLPATAAAERTVPKSLKILSIGNSHTVDATAYLYDIAKAHGVEEVIVGTLYVSGCSLAKHWNYASSEQAKYTYYKNESGTWTTTNSVTLRTGLVDEEWDYISIHESCNNAGLPARYATLDNLNQYLNEHKTNPDAKLVWNMAWAYQNGYVKTTDFALLYHSDQEFMQQSILSSVRARVSLRPDMHMVMPAGAAVQYARRLMGDKLNRDTVHLTTFGRVLVAYTWFCSLTGHDPNNFKYTEVAGSFDLANKKPKTPGMTMTQEDISILCQATASAISDPYMGTPELYLFEEGAVVYVPSAPSAGQVFPGYVFGSDTVADGALRTIFFPDDTVTENSNRYSTQFWYLKDGKVTNVADTAACDGRFGLHDVITAFDAASVTLDNGTHKDAASCTLGSIGSCGSEGRIGECAAQLTLDPKFSITDLRAAVLNGTESAATTLDAVKTLCDQGKAVVNTYAPNGAARAMLVLDHTLTVQVAPSENGSITLSTGGAGAADGSMVYAGVGTTVTLTFPIYKEGQEKQMPENQNIKL